MKPWRATGRLRLVPKAFAGAADPFGGLFERMKAPAPLSFAFDVNPHAHILRTFAGLKQQRHADEDEDSRHSGRTSSSSAAGLEAGIETGALSAVWRCQSAAQPPAIHATGRALSLPHAVEATGSAEEGMAALLRGTRMLDRFGPDAFGGMPGA